MSCFVGLVMYGHEHSNPKNPKRQIPSNLYRVVWQLCTRTDLEQIGSDAFVGTLLGHLLGQPRDLVRGLGDVLGALDEGALVPAAAPHQTRHLGHEQGHPLGRANDVITLKPSQRRHVVHIDSVAEIVIDECNQIQ